MNKGRDAEELVAANYHSKGFKLLERNYIFPKGKQIGEIDLILTKNREIVFVEVKARSSNKFGRGFESVDFFKQKKLVKTAKLYLQLHPKFQDFDYRIDVAEVDIDKSPPSVIILTNAIEDTD